MTHQPLSHKEEYAKKKRNARLVKFGLVFFLFVVIFFGLALLSRINRFRISSVEVSGNTLVSTEDLTGATKDFLSGNYIWFFPKNNNFLYPRKSLQKMLAEKFKRINTISVGLKDYQTISIGITERNLNALWCDTLPDQNASGQVSENCYFIDNNGLIFAEAPQFSGDAYFKYYGLISTSTDPIGSQYIEVQQFKNLENFISRVQDLSLRPVYLSSSENGQFTIGLSNGGYIYIDTKEPLTKSADNLKALIETVSTTTTPLNFDYIDLRFGNKLYYKLR